MQLRRPSQIRFPVLRGRSYGFRTLPLALQPDRTLSVSSKPLPYRGAQADTISDPKSRRQIDSDRAPSPGREYLGRTEDALNSGPVPDRIDRKTAASNDGNIGDQMGGWPYDGNALFIPHQPIPRKPITVTPFSRTIDTGVTVPAIPIGGAL
jgi:hypothetical protein